MDPTAAPSAVKKQEDDDKADKRDSKPVVRTLNRVPRACNACRKQKMRCEGADNPPCRRCRNNGLECLFEKPSREATLTGEAGLERIRSLEAHVAEISRTQTNIANTLADLVAHLRGPLSARSPSAYPQSFHHQSPANMNSPSMSTPTASHPHIDAHSSPQGSIPSFPSSATPTMNAAPLRQPRASLANTAYQNHSGHPPNQPPIGPDHHPASMAAFGNYPHGAHAYNAANQGAQPPVLPPFSSIQGTNIAPPASQSLNLSSIRFNNEEAHRPMSRSIAQGKKRAGSSVATSPNTSDVEDDDHGELPPAGLVAPWEVLRGLADVASERAAKENGESSEPNSRTRTPSPERHSKRSFKRRKTKHETHPTMTADVVTKGIITESQARELFKTFYEGCSTFLPVFDASYDTYDALRVRSPFAVSCICMVAARVLDGGGKPSKIYKDCLEEIQRVSKESLFLPVRNAESVQAMILVAGWSDNGWLIGGHAVRMAMEFSMHKAWPRLLRRIRSGKANSVDDRGLVVASRIWFCLYLYEHQLSYGTGRPAIMKDDESIRDCRRLLQHPLTIEDDTRLVSTVELMVLREYTHNILAPFEGPVTPEHLDLLNRAGEKFNAWFDEWDKEFSRKYEDAAFYRQSLQLQVLHALLFHNATALRGINCTEDLNKAPSHLVELARRSLGIAAQTVELTVKSDTYRRGLRYAVHYTHATATFAASLLLRLCRLFPGSCNMQDVCGQVESLMQVLFNIPGKRYALTLQIMLAKRRRAEITPSPASKAAQVPGSAPMKSQGQPQIPAQSEPRPPVSALQQANIPPAPAPVPVPPSSATPRTSVPLQQQPSREILVDNSHPNSRLSHAHIHAPVNQDAYPPVYENTTFVPADAPVSMPSHPAHNMHPAIIAQHISPHAQRYPQPGEAEHMWQGVSHDSHLWTTDQSLGGVSFTQHGMDAFILPTDYLPQQIW